MRTSGELPSSAPRIAIIGLFFLSGLASLIYQVVWMRYLALFFGSDVYSAAITLSSFMGGLSIGSYLAHRFAGRVARPLVVYGLLELLIGLYALFFSDTLGALDGIFRHVYLTSLETDLVYYNATRLGIAAAVLVMPTTMMGATLPLIVEQFSGTNVAVGKLNADFYSANTTGALVGVVAGGFLLFPAFGFTATTWIAATVNVVIGLATIFLGFTSAFAPQGVRSGHIAPTSAQASHPKGAPADAAARFAILATMFLSGMAAMAFEVVATRILTQSFSATVYSFAIMLACFLMGIAYGSFAVSQNVDRYVNAIRRLAMIEIGVAFLVVLLAAAVQILPGFFGSLLWSLVASLGDNFGAASVIAKFIVAFFVFFVPAAFLGSTFPIAVRAWTPGSKRASYGTGAIYAANTAGGVLGAVLAAFWAIPQFGARGALFVVAGLFAFAGWLLLLRAPTTAPVSRSWIGPSLLTGLAALVAIVIFRSPPQTIANYGLQTGAAPEVLFHGEGVAHTIDIVRNQTGHVIMMVDGNVEADTTLIQRRHFIMKGHLPLLLHPDPRDVVVVGLGIGITLAATERHPTIERINVVELNPEMVLAQASLKAVNGDVLARDKITLRIDDARNFLAREVRIFDMITADPIHPRIAGVGYLYTKEYFEAIKRLLARHGVVCQWMPMYNISKNSFDVAFRTFATTFPNAGFWYVRGHGLFMATLDDRPVDLRILRERFSHPAVKADFASIGISSPEELVAHLLMGPAEIRTYLASETTAKPINTDDNGYLEHRAPFEFLHTTKSIVTGLLPFLQFNRSAFGSATALELEAIEVLWNQRKGRLLEELGEPIQ